MYKQLVYAMWITNPSPNRKIIAITGGPCGGKTTLIDELCTDPFYKAGLIPLPEAVFYVLQTKTSPKEKLFQKMMVEVQAAKHRHENPKQAEHLDSLLADTWAKHPNYYFIESNADWEIKRKVFTN